MGSHFKRLLYNGLLSLKSGTLMLVLAGLALLVFATAYFVSKHIKIPPPDFSGLSSGDSRHN
jgi:hypothetical protein